MPTNESSSSILQTLFNEASRLAEFKLEIGASLGLHIVGLLVLISANSCSDSHVLKRPKSVAISAVAAPPLKGALARKKSTASNTKKTSSNTKKKTPTPKKSTNTLPSPEKTDIPKPKKEIEKEPEKKEPEKKEPEEKEPEKKEPSREELIKQMLSQAEANSDESSPDGDAPENRSPDGSDAPANGPRGFGKVDPELVRYIQACRASIMPNWTPLPTLVAANPNLEVTLVVSVAKDGKMSNPRVHHSSGNRSFDKTALMSIYKTGSLPPPPINHRENAAAGVLITLSAQDKN